MRTADEFHRGGSRLDGLQAHCKHCYRSRYSADGMRRQQILYRYGLTWEAYTGLHSSQGGACAICAEPITLEINDRLKSAHIDHDHESGVVRGLLCHYCNTGLGYMRDDEERLARAIGYLAGAKARPLPYRRAKLKRSITEQQAAAAHALLDSGVGATSVARQLGISYPVVRSIASGLTWKHAGRNSGTA
jgi:hypothetical protein